jgi:hypothetical protein
MSEEEKILISILNKEIEEKNKDIKKLNDLLMLSENYIHKDKIREKIKDLEKKAFDNEINYSNYHYKTEILKELLEEN